MHCLRRANGIASTWVILRYQKWTSVSSPRIPQIHLWGVSTYPYPKWKQARYQITDDFGNNMDISVEAYGELMVSWLEWVPRSEAIKKHRVMK